MRSRYATLMGYTAREIDTVFKRHIQELAQRRGCGRDDIIDEMRLWYNGYQFAKESVKSYRERKELKREQLRQN